MRHISNKDFNNPPPELTAPDVVTHLTSIINSNGTIKPEAKFYKGANKEIVNELKDLYHNKCAYCEQPTHDPHIEHYRPKASIGATSQLFISFYQPKGNNFCAGQPIYVKNTLHTKKTIYLSNIQIFAEFGIMGYLLYLCN